MPTPPTLRRRSAAIALSLVLLTTKGAYAALPETGVKNADFQRVENGRLADWSGGNEHVTAVSEGGNTFLRIDHGAEKKATQLLQVVPIDPSWKRLAVRVRMRATKLAIGEQSWNDARVAFQFLGKDGKMVGTWPDVPRLQKDSDWVSLETTNDVPAGAVSVQLTPALLGAAGRVDFDDLTIAAGTGPVAAPVVQKPVAAPADAKLPEAMTARAASPRAEAITPLRSQMDLSGLWRFAPVPTGGAAPEIGWGYIAVPGSWMRNEDIAARGAGPAWHEYNGKTLGGAWYERTVDVPADWDGRAIVLELDRVSTDATIFVDGKSVGQVTWPTGTVDLTAALTPGKPATLRLFVVATTDKDEVLVMMGNAPGQNYTIKAELSSGGLIGNARLLARPKGGFVSDVFVQPSVRRNELTVDVELTGVTAAGAANWTAELVDEKGQVEKTFKVETPLQAAPVQRVKLTWPWADARKWDLDKPNLYTLRLNADGNAVTDAVRQRFGFREFWVEGKNFMLNGTPLRLRPTLADQGPADKIAAVMAREKAMGFNFIEQWPGDPYERGNPAAHTRWYDVADEQGVALSAITANIGWMGSNVTAPDRMATFAANAEKEMRKYRNHPSILMWGSSGNALGANIAPDAVGNREAAAKSRAKNNKLEQPDKRGTEAMRLLKEIDPSRPIFFHNGGAVGDVFTANLYLNLMPLQERSEWLSYYAANGDMPVMYVEFGTPLYSSLMRGRNSYGPTAASEPFITEYSAGFIGTEAYGMEAPEYRKEIVTRFKGDQNYEGWHYHRVIRSSPPFLAMQAMFHRDTLRTWRTWGITGGMIPWDDGYATFDGKRTVAGEALAANNQPTLAWIAGPADAFTDRSHSYVGGEKVEKQVAVLNDTRDEQPYRVTWTATVGGDKAGGSEATGTLKQGQTLFVPIEFTVPQFQQDKADGSIEMTATIGEAEHRDTFALRVFPAKANNAAQAAQVKAFVLDPQGRSTAMLELLGVSATQWDRNASGELLIVGRGALADEPALAANIDQFARSGGRVIVLSQPPEFMRKQLGLRVGWRSQRNAFPVDADHPVLAGLDSEDLRDWRGASTLVKPYPTTEELTGPDQPPSKTTYPYAGWRWGNRGALSTAAIEVPHRAGWRPLLVTDFDLAYSPLLELNLGSGRITWCQLDLEDYTADPAAMRLASQLVSHAATAPLAPRRQTVLMGDEQDVAFLNTVGVEAAKVENVPNPDHLLVVGRSTKPDEDGLRKFLSTGGRVLFLPRAAADPVLGVGFVQEKAADLKAPEVADWVETAGLTTADLRWRAATDAWLVGPGAEATAGGQIARLKVGEGMAVFTQVDPDRFEADTKTYFRKTRWRQTRTISQLLANLGASFATDTRPLRPELPPAAAPELSMAGEWRARLLQSLPAAPSPAKGHVDPSISEEAKALVGVDVNDGDWQKAQMPRGMETIGKEWNDRDGEAVFRRTFEVPESLQGGDLLLSLGTIDDNDDVYLNGTRIGGRGESDEANWSVKREYAVPANLLRKGQNVLAVRVWDRFGGGGFMGVEADMRLGFPSEAPKPKGPGLYHADYREDFEQGDEPHRFYNW
jgi:beta-galactosidase